ncbi:MAG TPA: CHAT domain-containing protein, partial [Candidatus Saccharicenans sp.]|nr:CHAT domain-containing protein [Candidatus Saccharicenans sp.]
MVRREVAFSLGVGARLKLFVFIFFFLTVFMAANDTRTVTSRKLEEARQLRLSGKFAESLKVLENEVSHKPGRKNSSELTAGWLNIALNYWNLGEVSRAENAFIFAEALADEKNDQAMKGYARTSLEIIRLYQEAKIKRQEKSYQEAEALFLSGINLAQKNGMKEMELKCLRQLSLLYWDMGEMEKFASSSESQLSIARLLNNRHEEIRSLDSIGVYYSKKNNLSLSFLYFNRALALAEKENLLEMVPESLTNMAVVCYQLGLYSLAIYYLEKALKIYEKQDNLASTISVLYALALSIYRQKQNSPAYFAREQPEALLTTALKLSRQARDEALEARILNNLGYVSLNDNLDQSEQYLNLSLAKGFKLKDKEVISSALNNLATINLKRKKVLPAIRLYERALQTAREINNWEEVWQDYAGLADCYEELGNFSQAFKNYQQALATFEKVRDNINFDFYKIGFDRSKRKVYEGLIRVLVKIKDSKRDSKVDEQLFNTINQLQARVFLEEMDNLKKGRTSSASSRELAELEGVINDFFNRDENLGEEDSFGELLELEHRYLQLWVAELDGENKKERKDISSQPSLLSLQENLLSGGKVILDYLLGENESYCFLFSRTEFQIFHLPAEKEIEKSVKLYIKLLADPTSEEEDLKKVGAELGHWLLPPLSGLSDAVTSLAVIPDGILNYLPFETLRLNNQNSGERQEYLIEKFPVSYGLSLASLYRSTQEKDQGDYKKDFLGFGNPLCQQKEKDQMLARLYYADNRSLSLRPSLSELPYSQQEIKRIAALFPAEAGDLFYKKKATEDRFKALDLTQYRIIHLACHGLVSEQFPLRSSLILATRKGSQEDGFLTVREIYQLRLRTELIVLSACESSRGLVEKREGVIGLPRIFLLVGCRSVISSLWAVNDLATQEL